MRRWVSVTTLTLDNMRRKTVFRLMIGVLISVVLWILWFSTTFDADGADFEDSSEDGARSFGRLFVENPKLPGEIIDLPKDMSSLDIPELEHAENMNRSHKGTDQDKVTGLTFQNRVFFLNGQPFRIFSGAVHYFRIIPEYWEDRLKKLKACGLNTVETYVAWNLHEPSPGVFNFNGMLDLKKFIALAARLGLYVILRPGPFICSEFEFGGLPGWLLHDPDMKVRTNYPGYVSAVNKYFSILLPMMHNLQFTEGGPIIMFQVENEYSAYGENTEHLKLLVYLMKSHGIKELLVTSDHKFKDKYRENKELDFSKYALLTDNFDILGSNSFSLIRSLNKHFPVMVMEFWTGWFDVWGQVKHSTSPLAEVNKTLNFILDEGGSFNLYMFIGGTNFGFTAGAINISGYQPMVTSYDYNAILSEAGDITAKYNMVRKRLLQFYKTIGINSLPPIPPNTPKASYGHIQVSEVMEWDVFLSLIPIGTTDNKVNFMETYRDHDGVYNTMGYVVYSHQIGGNTHWNKMPGIQLTGFARDRLTAVLNSEVFFVTDNLKKTQEEEDMLLHYNWDKTWQRDPYEYMYNYSNDYEQIFDNVQWLLRFLTKAQGGKTDHLFLCALRPTKCDGPITSQIPTELVPAVGLEVAEKMAKRPTKPSQRLDLMIENLGRVNYSPREKAFFDHQRKGLQGPVFRYIFDIIEEWNIRFINFSPEQCKILSKSSTWSSIGEYDRKLKERSDREKLAPALYRAFLNITGKPNDTFVKMEVWGKGVFVVNGFHLGRYWSIGPQKTLYLPGPLLKSGTNEILIFEEIKRGTNITFQNFPEL